MRFLLLSLALVAFDGVSSANTPPTRYDSDPPSNPSHPPSSGSGYGSFGGYRSSSFGGSSYGGGPSSGYGSPSSSYGGPSSGYSSHSSGYGYAPRYAPPPPPPAGEEPLDLLDKLWERVSDIERGNKFAAEQLDALDARMSLLKKEVDELQLVVFPALARADQNQNNDIGSLNEQLDSLNQTLNALEDSINWLEVDNDNNRQSLADLENNYAEERDQDIGQDGDVANLNKAAVEFKSKLFVVLNNEFELFEDEVEVTAGKLDNTKSRELLRMCETGSVTLYGDDRKAEYVFQSDFADVPSVIYSITGLEANLDARDEPRSYGYGPPPKEPNAIGCVVHAYTTKRSVTFQGIEMSFGDTTKLSVDVDFQVCSILP